ncbi:hypothetical protein [Dietzia sp. B32]|uniref:hypothetical protein n=1 Tax=Dietzia sp. B32 TaxID=2915130 RepID=UPI0021AD7DA6|nr:hypothetical protein [Dietzia sp. B32]UVE96319.1 hypothetical protein L8M95_05990 [Dietzia sp. B32]
MMSSRNPTGSDVMPVTTHHGVAVGTPSVQILDNMDSADNADNADSIDDAGPTSDAGPTPSR